MNKIAVIIPYRFVPSTNGGHSAAFGFCEFLAKEREVVVVSTTNNAEAPIPFRLVKLFTDHFYKYFSPTVFIKLWRFFRQENITHCITQQPFIALIALPIARMLGIKIYIYAHNIEFQRFKSIYKWWWRLIWLVEWWMYRATDGVLFISEEDMKEAVPLFRLSPERCISVPFGTRYPVPPLGRDLARQAIIIKHDLNPTDFILLFFGSLSYQPNTEALEAILSKINPILLQKANFNYKILICGGGLPSSYNKLINYKSQHIDYVGFVEDIEQYVQAADVALNPVITGGGIKTKLIEAIGLGTTVVSTSSGAKGVNAAVCGEKLIIVADHDVNEFAEAVLHLKTITNTQTPASFYETYYWGNAIKKILHQIK